METIIYVEGMSCQSCVSNISRNINKIDGVRNVNINLLSKEVVITHDNIDLKNVINAINNLGYHASFTKKDEKDKNKLIDKLIVSSFLLILLMYLAMGHMIPFIYPSFLDIPIINVSLQFVLATIIILINFNYYKNGFKHLFKLSPNMDSLVSIGSFASYLYATFYLIQIIILSVNKANIHNFHNMIYFDSSAMILVFVSIGKMLETYSKNKAKKEVLDLVNLMPNEVLILKNDKEEITKLEDVNIDDLIILKPGDIVPLDGLIIDGITTVNEATITGEAMPVTKEIGDKLISGTLNISSKVMYKVEKLKGDSTISIITERVIKAANSKPNIIKLVDKISFIFVPVVIFLSLITFLIWILISKDFSTSLNYSICVLVISCPCALGLATPLAVMISSGVAAKNHILFKDCNALEKLNHIDTILLDKTGTISRGILKVIEFKSYILDTSLISIARALEKYSTHPLALSIIEYSKDYNYQELEVTSFYNEVGYGIKGVINEKTYYIGNKKYLEMNNLSDDETHQKGILLYVFDSNKILGYFICKDTVSKSNYLALEYFQKLKLNRVVFSGDKLENVIEFKQNGYIDEIYAELLPFDKENILDEYQKNNKKPLVVGDGINDSIALKKAYVSASMKDGSMIAIDSSDIILTSGNLMDLVNGIYLSKKTYKIMKQNLFWALCYNLVGIPLAAGVLSFIGITLTPMYASFFMSISSLLVVFNSLRLKKFKGREEFNMFKYEFYVSDMMCMHCVSRIKEIIKAIPNIKDVEIDLNDKSVVVTSLCEIDLDSLFQIIKNNGYKPSI